MTIIQPEPMTIPAADNYPLSALFFAPTITPRGAVQINAATGVPKQFYAKFAHYLAEHGFATVVSDYRGIGGSRPASLRGFEATMREWGQLDMTGVLDWLAARVAIKLRNAFVGRALPAQLAALFVQTVHAPRMHAAIPGHRAAVFRQVKFGFRITAEGCGQENPITPNDRAGMAETGKGNFSI